MAIQREFLGWDGPCLPRAAAWLVAHSPDPAACDLRGYVVVVPGSRAGRRLLEILVAQTAERPLSPPQIVTAGQLPELLYSQDSPRIASPLQSLLARAAALRQADGDGFARLIAHRPEEDDLNAWLALARQIDELAADLAAEDLRFDQVVGRCANLPDFADEDRWRLLADLQNSYEELLAAEGVQDLHDARAAAVRLRRCRTQKQVILLAAGDLSRLQRLMLEQVADRVTALVHAPAEFARAFDEMGCAKVEHWSAASLDFPAERLTVVDRPQDQALAVAAALAEIGPKISPDQATVGLGDATLGPLVQRTIELAGAPARLAAGLPVLRTRPATMLAALAALLARRGVAELASAVRHPDLEAFVNDALGPGNDSWPALLDDYAQDHLPHWLDGQWLGKSGRAKSLADLEKTLMALTPTDWGTPPPLPHWATPCAKMLAAVFGRRPLDRFDGADATVIRVLTLIAEALGEQSSLSAEGDSTPAVTFAQAIQVTLAQLADAVIPPEAGEPAVELLGWLELQLDDAEHLVLTGFNEGAVPEARNSHWILPDHVRAALGMIDNRRRYARDMMMLTAILASRPDVRLIAGRFDADGSPLAPSRLALARDAAEIPAWIERFYPDKPAAAPPAAPLLAPGVPAGQSRFFVPPIDPEQPVPDRLPVTAFGDYLTCPYRFYLRHVLKLKGVDDSRRELTAAAFGNLVHEVLRDFGRSALATDTSADSIARFLGERLDAAVADRFGRRPPAAAVVQRELLRQRLTALARWQAEQSAEGWAIVPELVEKNTEAIIVVDGQPFTVFGRIDRFDRHEHHGHRILDYKSSDTAQDPDKHHRDASGQWIDLQLPLYSVLAEALGVTGPRSLGYVQLPKDLAGVGLAQAPWTAEELDSALDRAKEVIRLIRRRVFWPPRFPPKFDGDEFAAICMDDVLDRTHALDRSGRAEETR